MVPKVPEDDRAVIAAMLMVVTILGFCLAAAPTFWPEALALKDLSEAEQIKKYSKYSLLYDGIQIGFAGFLTLSLKEQGTNLPLSVNCLHFVTTFIDAAILKGPRFVKMLVRGA